MFLVEDNICIVCHDEIENEELIMYQHGCGNCMRYINTNIEKKIIE